MPAILQRLLCLLALSLLLTTSTHGVEELRISGASTMQPILKRIAPDFSAETRISLSISGGGSARGLAAVLSGDADIGMVSRSLEAEEVKQLQVTTIGHDALALVVHESNPLGNLRRDQVRDIFRGAISDWQTLNAGQTGAIVRVGKLPGRSTRQLFDHFFGLTAADYPAEMPIVGADSAGILYISIDPQAIAYISAGSIQRAMELGAPVKLLSIDGHPPRAEQILSGAYPYGRPLNLVSKRDASKHVRSLLEWLSSSKGQQAVQAEGFLRARAP